MLDNPEIQQLFKDLPFFEQMMITIARGLLMSSKLGVRFRLALGVFLSIGDLISDLIVIATYYEQGESGTARLKQRRRNKYKPLN